MSHYVDVKKLIEAGTYDTAQSAQFTNDIWRGATIVLNLTTLLSATLTVTVEAISSDGSAAVIFTGPAEAVAGQKRYTIRADATAGATAAAVALPRIVKVTATPGTPSDDVYSIEAELMQC